jgi:hypothetical protein
MSTPAISKESLHSVLSKVEELALPEGEYLTLCSILKKQFEKLPAEILFEEPRDTTIVFKGKKDITIAITHRIVYKGRGEDNYRYTINGVVKETNARQCGRAICEAHRVNLTKTILLNGEFETTYREYKNWAESVEHDPDGEDEYCDFNTTYLMLHMAGVSDS